MLTCCQVWCHIPLIPAIKMQGRKVSVRSRSAWSTDPKRDGVRQRDGVEEKRRRKKTKGGRKANICEVFSLGPSGVCVVTGASPSISFYMQPLLGEFFIYNPSALEIQVRTSSSGPFPLHSEMLFPDSPSQKGNKEK